MFCMGIAQMRLGFWGMPLASFKSVVPKVKWTILMTCLVILPFDFYTISAPCLCSGAPLKSHCWGGHDPLAPLPARHCNKRNGGNRKYVQVQLYTDSFRYGFSMGGERTTEVEEHRQKRAHATTGRAVYI